MRLLSGNSVGSLMLHAAAAEPTCSIQPAAAVQQQGSRGFDTQYQLPWHRRPTAASSARRPSYRQFAVKCSVIGQHRSLQLLGAVHVVVAQD
jgi:hypothetical protein